MRVLKSITFVYGTREDRVLAAINSGKPEAWSCWLTRRLALVLLERAMNLLASTSALAQRAPADIRGELVAFERDAAIAETAKAMSHTPADVLAAGMVARAELQRILQMLQTEVAKADWFGTSAKSAAITTTEETGPKPARH